MRKKQEIDGRERESERANCRFVVKNTVEEQSYASSYANIRTSCFHYMGKKPYSNLGQEGPGIIEQITLTKIGRHTSQGVP